MASATTTPVVAITVVDDEEDEEIFHSAEDTPDESGHDDDSAPPPLSREDQVTAITALIEFYFGDENFARDRFLRTKAREDPEGWLKLELIASFKRVRKLTDDHSVLVESARASEVVVFDEANGKIKRKHPLPVNPRELLYFTAVLENLAADATVEAVTTLCTQAGFEPNKVVIVTNSNTKDDVTADTRRLVEEECKSSKVKPHPAFDPDDSIKPKPSTPPTPIALVTFNSVDRCNDACVSLSRKLGDWRTGVLAAPLCKKDKRARRKKKRNGEEVWSDSGTEGSDASAMSDAERSGEMPRPPRQLASCSPRQGRAMAARSPLGRDNVRGYHSSPNSPMGSPMGSPSPNRRRDQRRPRPQLLDSKSPGLGRVSDKWRARSASPSWRPGSVARSESPSMRGIDGVKRMPIGPDGSPGFSRGRGKRLPKEM